ncbi:SAVED domain-containing protein [Ilyomonas limi]|uniref:SAVED domain-containing protein n=1 Tax=Ilyomonas limi TaxID=2575867 RepID=A0A4U3KYX5_9BACT|nr:SAVED domain-containing protein [Ilyomonas limi]TKK66366.1 SAVED domain-containing protein [Ilyomonas limi]
MAKTNRGSIPETVKLQLWVKSAGRCEFKGCNKPVWYNGLTLSAGNFSEVAHIIGYSKSGPRGTDKSHELQKEFSNLMLLCYDCHKEVDDNPDKYPAELLRKWKQEHEGRIEIQTSHPEDIHKSTVLTGSINIGDRITPINFEAVRNAMFPKYPTDFKGIKIEETNFDRFAEKADWQSFAERCIKRRLVRELEQGTDDVRVKHLSVFAIAPMPLLIYLGRCIGDTIPCDIYQSHRNIANTNKTWNWQEADDSTTSFEISSLKQSTGEKVLLKLAISDTIGEDKYACLLDDSVSVYEITVAEPNPHFAKSKKHLELFSYEYRKLLNQIQAKHGRNCKITILPAIPLSFALECGRVLLPTKDPQIFVCEYYTDGKGFKEVLQVN